MNALVAWAINWEETRELAQVRLLLLSQQKLYFHHTLTELHQPSVVTQGCNGKTAEV